MKPRSIFTIESCDVTHLQCYSKYGNSGVSNIQSQTYPTTQGGAKVTWHSMFKILPLVSGNFCATLYIKLDTVKPA